MCIRSRRGHGVGDYLPDDKNVQAFWRRGERDSPTAFMLSQGMRKWAVRIANPTVPSSVSLCVPGCRVSSAPGGHEEEVFLIF